MLLRITAQQARCPAALAIRQTAGGTDFAEAARLAHVALDAPPCRDDPVCLWRALIVLVAAGDLVAAEANADRLADHTAHAQVLAQIARQSGDLATARELLASALPAVGSAQLLSVSLLVQVLVDAGDVDEAEKTFLAGDLDNARWRSSALRPAFLTARAAVHRARGRPLAAYVDHLEAGQNLVAMGIVSPAIVPWRGNAALSAYAAQREELAQRLAAEELAAARRWGEPRTVGAALCTLGRVGGGDGTALLSDAADLMTAAGARHELAVIRLELGDRLAARGDDGAARGEYTSAHVTASRTGNARHLLRASEALARLSPATVRALTRQEDLVASLAEAGLSNRAIAQRLFLTVSTVEVHLSNVYRKLGVHGREDLSRSLRER